MHKTDHNDPTKRDSMTLSLMLDDEATIIQPSPKTRYARIAKKQMALLNYVNFVLIA